MVPEFTHIVTTSGCAPCDYVKAVHALGAFPGVTLIDATDIVRVLADRGDLRRLLDGLRSDAGALRMPAWLQVGGDGRLAAFGRVAVSIEFFGA